MTISYPLIGTLNEENWALIPSDPAVFNDMLKEYGIDEAIIEELFALNLDHLKKEKTVHGLIFISKYDADSEKMNPNEIDPDADEIVFTSQVVTNVCGTLALLAVLFNANIKNKGPIIENFLQFTKGFTPVNRGLCIGNSTEIRRIHDAYGKTSILADRAYANNNVPSEEVEVEDVHHYTAFIFKNGYLWEIDGLKPRPVKTDACTSDTWLNAAEQIIRHRVEVVSRKYPDEENFSMMAVVENEYPSLMLRNESLKTSLKFFDSAMTSRAKTKAQTVRRNRNEFYKNFNQNSPEYDHLRFIWDELDNGNYAVKEQVEDVRTLHLNINDKIQTYEYNQKLAEEDAIRQKFDYFPFINELISISHKRGSVEDPTGVKPKKRGPNQKKRKVSKQPRETKEEKPVKKRKR